MTQSPNLQVEDDFLPNHAALFRLLLETVAWDDRMAARRTASFGKAYNYSQLTYAEQPLPPSLIEVADRLEVRLKLRFNNCLLNFYETGDNSMGFHSDDTAGLVAGTGVAIVSLGSSREITFRSVADRTLHLSHSLAPGSVLYMDDVVQREWQHAIKRQPGVGPRISLTWRAVAEV